MTIENPFAEYGDTAPGLSRIEVEHNARIEALRSKMGEDERYWNHRDPVVHVILDLIEAQNEIAYCEMNDASFSYNYNHGQYMNNQMAWGEAIKKRRAAAKELTKAMRLPYPGVEISQRLAALEDQKDIDMEDFA